MFTKKFVRDLAERAGMTFLQGFITVLVAMPFLAGVVEEGTFDLEAGQRVLVSALAGGTMAALSTVKSLLAKRTGGEPDSASLVRLND